MFRWMEKLADGIGVVDEETSEVPVLFDARAVGSVWMAGEPVQNWIICYNSPTRTWSKLTIFEVVAGDTDAKFRRVLKICLDSTRGIEIALPVDRTTVIAAAITDAAGAESELSEPRLLVPSKESRRQGRQLHFQAVLDRIDYPDFEYKCYLSGEALYLQIKGHGKCNVTGDDLSWRSGKWLLSEHMLDSEIVQKALKATLTALEHEARELFKYRGRAIFDPHYDVDELWELRGSQGAVVQRPPPGK